MARTSSQITAPSRTPVSTQRVWEPGSVWEPGRVWETGSVCHVLSECHQRQGLL